MATKEEWAAMNEINPHFTFRERTAFLVGYRKAKERCARVADELNVDEARDCDAVSVCQCGADAAFRIAAKIRKGDSRGE